MPRFAVASLLVLACWPIGCIDDSSTIPTTIVPNLVTADPTTFLGGAQCGSDVRSYVVKLYDVTSGARVRVGTSTPTECTRQTSFGSTVITYGHAYVADIDGYNRDDLVPDTSPGAGPGDLVDPVTLERVAKGWTTTCGEQSAPPDAEPSYGSDASDAASDFDGGSSDDAGAVSVDASTDSAEASIDLSRFPTVVLSSGEVVLHPCFPLRAIPPAAPNVDGGSSPDQADATDDSTDAPSEQRILPEASADAGSPGAGADDARGLDQ